MNISYWNVFGIEPTLYFADTVSGEGGVEFVELREDEYQEVKKPFNLRPSYELLFNNRFKHFKGCGERIGVLLALPYHERNSLIDWVGANIHNGWYMSLEDVNQTMKDGLYRLAISFDYKEDTILTKITWSNYLIDKRK